MTPNRHALFVPLAAACFAAAAAGCTISRQVGVREPTSAAPQPQAAAAPAAGSLFSDGAYRPLFEDRRARQVGDTIVVLINEKLSASQKSQSSAARSGGVSLDVPIVKGMPGKSFQGASVGADSSNKFEGKGETSNDNAFTGTITATVIEVLGNGNLVISGEKRLGINHNSETLKFSGVVSPAHITGSNTVVSTQVADARLLYSGQGYIDEAQNMGWLARFFLTISPF
jgi:flagellar L-ring protein precursor FlgH